MLERRGREAGLPGLHPHQFRHTFAHQWLAEGGAEVDLMRLPGGGRGRWWPATVLAPPTPAPVTPTADSPPATGCSRELILIRVQPPGSFPQDGTCDLGERCTAGDRWRPLGTARLRWHVDHTWTRHAPLAGAAALRVADLGWQGDPRRLPPTSEPRLAIALLGGALAGSGPGTSPCIDGLSLVTGMVVPRHAACSNHADDGGCLGDMAPRDRSVLVSRSWCATAGEVGFEPASTLHHSPRSWPGRCGDQWFLRTGRDRSCPPKTSSSRCRADPPRTEPAVTP